MSDCCYIYIMCAKCDGKPSAPLKVGITSNVAARVSTINTASPFPVYLLAAYVVPTKDHARALERGFHKVKAKKRMNGEWFDMEPAEALSSMWHNFWFFLTRHLGMSHDEARECMQISGFAAVQNAGAVE